MADKTGITIAHVELPHVIKALKEYDARLEVEQRGLTLSPETKERWEEVYTARRSVMRVLRRLGRGVKLGPESR